MFFQDMKRLRSYAAKTGPGGLVDHHGGEYNQWTDRMILKRVDAVPIAGEAKNITIRDHPFGLNIFSMPANALLLFYIFVIY